MKILTLLVFLFSFNAIYSQVNTRIDWALGLTSGSANRGHAVAVDGSGNVYITGFFQSTINFDPTGTTNLTSNGGYDIFVAKYDTDGALTWAFNLGSASNDEGIDIALDGSNNVYITGYFQGSNVDFDPSGSSFLVSSGGDKDVFLAKYDTDGNFGWAFNIGLAGDDQGNSIGVDASDNLYIIGNYTGTSVDFDPSASSTTHSATGVTDIFIAKYSSSMAYQWSKGIGNSFTDSGEALTLDNSDNFYITGSFIGSVDFNPGGTPVNLASGALGGAAYIAKYNSSGTCQAAMQIGGTTLNEAAGGSDIVTDGTTSLYLTGAFINASAAVDFDPSASTNSLTSTSDSSDIFVAKYTLALAYEDAFRVGGSSGVNIGIGLDLDASNNLYVTGVFTGSNIDFDQSGSTNTLSSTRMRDIFIAEYNSSLVFQEAFSFGGYLDDYAYEIKVDASGNMYPIGYYSSSNIDFDPSTTNTHALTYSGVNDIFAIKYHATEQLLPVEMTYFKGTGQNENNLLQWQTATEKNNSHFEVEWSSNGVHFTKIGEVSGYGNTLDVKDYEFLHRNLTSSIHYYRLKQVDFDGKFEYSSVISINRQISEDLFLEVYPNPVNEYLTINTNYQGSVEVFNVSGQIVRSLNITNQSNVLNINDLEGGIYFIKIGHEVRRIIKR